MIHYPVVAKGQMTRVLQEGDAEQTVIFLHGGMTNANRWRGSLEPTAHEGWRALAIDLPGHGFAAETKDDEVGTRHVSKFLSAFMDEMSIERAVIVGASFGGHVASVFTCDFPDRVHALVLVGPVGFTDWPREERQKLWSDHREITRDAIASNLKRQWRREPTWQEVEETFRFVDTPGSKQTAAATARYMTGEAWENEFVNERLNAVVPPISTLVVWGKEDWRFPVANAYQIHEMVPASFLAVVDGADHDVDVDCPNQFHALLVDVLRNELGAHRHEGVHLYLPGQTSEA